MAVVDGLPMQRNQHTAGASRRRSSRSRPAPSRRPPEQAQLVWRRARDLVDAAGGDQFAVALELLRAAHHSPAVMMHALRLGRTYLADHPDDHASRGGVAILEAATKFLGVKPRAHDIPAGPSPC